ncbi:MAG: hypothetical protein KBF21_07655 [Thermoanaerobaculia bacterium]|nr:hypothetical protein [Thermoanaerobaculia bacterium]
MSDLTQKRAGAGLFFQKAAKPRGGRFFRDLPGRDDATFHAKTAAAGDAGDDAPPPMPDMGEANDAGEEGGGGMYGTGKPKAKKASPVKVAGAAPSDWAVDEGLPTGFHRPAKEQPEALEAGGERFHDSRARLPEYSAPTTRHGLVEGGAMALPGTASSQMGKHASMRYLGTAYSEKTAASAEEYASRAGDYIGDRASEAKTNLGVGLRELAGKADEGLKSVTRSPMGAGVAALVLGHLGMRGLKGAAGGAKRLIGRKPPMKATGTILGSVRKLITGR